MAQLEDRPSLEAASELTAFGERSIMRRMSMIPFQRAAAVLAFFAGAILTGAAGGRGQEAMPKADPRKWVAPEDLASVIAFLASDAARAIHGAAIPVTGLS